MDQWYYQCGKDVLGPVSWQELQRKADEGEILPENSVRDGADGPWLAASQIDELFLVPTGSIADVVEDPSAGEGTAETLSRSEGVSSSDPDRSRRPLILRPCADCGTMVSRHAISCPNCGRSFRDLWLTLFYGGEHPVPVAVFFTLLAVAFILASPVVVYRAATKVAASTLKDEPAAATIALTVTVVFAITIFSCALLGGAVGTPRMAYYTGLLLGLFFGPLGVFVAFAINKRPQCPNCFSRLGGLVRECPCCRAHVTWTMRIHWY